MRKLKLQMQISVDGFVSTGPNDEQHWVTWAWEEIKPYVLELAGSADTMVIGKKLAVDFIPHWQGVLADKKHEMYELAKSIVGAKKYVFTKTLAKSEWDNTEIVKGDLVEEINKIKNQKGKDILVVGGSSFVSDLIKNGLVDQFHLFVNPVVLGSGVPIFGKIENFQQLKLKKTIAYDCGIVLHNYELKNE